MIDLKPLIEKGLFSEGYRSLRDGEAMPRGFSVNESPDEYGKPSPQKIRERLVSAVWFDQKINKDALVLDNGKPVSIISKGRWNLVGGPDFTHAEIRVGTRPLKGDVEIHTYSSDWYKHNHNQNSAYNNVVLHVVMFNDRSVENVRRCDGSAIPQLTLSRFLDRPLAELAAHIDITDYPAGRDAADGPCSTSLVEKDDWAGGFLDLAGDWRMLDKAARFEAMLKVDSPQIVLYRGIMEALGYPVNKMSFRRLAALVGPEALHRQIARPDTEVSLLSGQALLMGTAGLIPESTTDFEGDICEYVRGIREEWAKINQESSKAQMEKSEWCFGGTRPQNYPYRRIAAIIAFVGGLKGKDSFVEIIRILGDEAVSPKKARGRIAAFFAVADECAGDCAEGRYWLRHNIFGGAQSKTARRMFSAEIIGNITVNILVPLCLAFARKTGDEPLERALHRFYAAHPKLPPSNITRFMLRRMFGRQSGTTVVNNARRQQALYQIYRDCCEHNDTHCESCVLMRAIGGQ